MITTEQKLAALRSIHRPSTTMTAAIIADLEHLPALVGALIEFQKDADCSCGMCEQARAALAHFTEDDEK